MHTGKTTKKKGRDRGFSLVELMITVAIMGTLCSVAIPSFMKYINKSKTAEAYLQVRRIYEASRAYLFSEANARGTPNTIPIQFPDAEAATPAVSCCLAGTGGKCPSTPSDWDSAGWQALTFAMGDPHYYRFEYDSTGSAAPGPGSSFTARIIGDLDCDLSYSTFEMSGYLSAVQRDMLGSAAVYTSDPLE